VRIVNIPSREPREASLAASEGADDGCGRRGGYLRALDGVLVDPFLESGYGGWSTFYIA
jgi:hypothetical protein